MMVAILSANLPEAQCAKLIRRLAPPSDALSLPVICIVGATPYRGGDSPWSPFLAPGPVPGVKFNIIPFRQLAPAGNRGILALKGRHNIAQGKL